MSGIDTPCKGCEERSVGCHDTCERYAEFRKSMDAMSKKDKYRKWLQNIGVPEKAKEKSKARRG